jgi:hypothetical protein
MDKSMNAERLRRSPADGCRNLITLIIEKEPKEKRTLVISVCAATDETAEL